jgi:hypothetical protein
MNRVLAVVAFFASALLLPVTASATPAGLTGPLQTYQANQIPGGFGSTHIATVETYLNGYFGVTDITYLGRYTGATATFAPESVLSGTGAFFTITGGSTGSGTWAFDPGNTDYVIYAVEVSTSGKADLYAVTPPSNSGNWDTNDINGHNLSHLDFYARLVPHKTPEPISLFLMGGGLAGLQMVRRKKRA